MTYWRGRTELSIRNLVVNVQQVDSAKAMLMKRQKEVEKASPMAFCFSIMSTDIDLPSLVAYLLLLQKWFWMCRFIGKAGKKTPHVSIRHVAQP